MKATVPCPSCGAENLPGSRFCSTCATPMEAAPASVAETRKTVTVLFCDATSSTALGERIDPESLRALMTRYFDVIREVIEFHGGVIEKFIGDAAMAVFGVPVVHEDDALRACRAAIEIRQRLAELDVEIKSERGTTVEWRMGINTGEVVAGDATTGQRIVTGDAVNVAARLEGAAPPGEILLGAETYALVRTAVSADAAERAEQLVGLGDGNEFWQREARGVRRVAMVNGPTPVEDVTAVLEAEVDRAEGGTWVTDAYRGLGRMRALQGRLDEARVLAARHRAAFEELGNREQLVSVTNFEGEIEHQAGNDAEAARLIRESFDAMTATGDRSYASTFAVDLGEVYLDLHEDGEAWRFATIARDTSSSDDVISQAGGRAIQARVLSRRGDHDGAEAVAHEAADIMARTDYIVRHGDMLVHLARVLHEDGKRNDAVAAARDAVALYEQKGATFFVDRTERLIAEWGG